MSGEVRTKALAVLREGRVTICHARSDDCKSPPFELVARVTASQPGNGPWTVDMLDGWWSCSCPAPNGTDCKHVAAVAMVCGYPSEARRDKT